MMKTITKEVKVLICEECGRDLEIADPPEDPYYKAKWGCNGCGRCICGECDVGGGFSWHGRSLRLCQSCMENMKVVELVKKLIGKV